VLVLHHGWGTLYLGHGEEKEAPQWYELDSFFTEKFLGFMMLNRGFYPVWDTWYENRKDGFQSGITIFNGHANIVNKQWLLCADAVCDMPAQEFVNEHDGASLLILLLCCNPKNLGRITSQKSLVVYSRSALSLHSMQSRRSRQLIHIPGHGDFIGTTDGEKLREIACQHGYKPRCVG